MPLPPHGSTVRSMSIMCIAEPNDNSSSNLLPIQIGFAILIWPSELVVSKRPRSQMQLLVPEGSNSLLMSYDALAVGSACLPHESVPLYRPVCFELNAAIVLLSRISRRVERAAGPAARLCPCRGTSQNQWQG
jgi:hypothetical protein